MWPLVLSILVCCIPHSFANKSDYCFSQCLVYCKQLTNILMNYVVVEAFLLQRTNTYIQHLDKEHLIIHGQIRVLII